MIKAIKSRANATALACAVSALASSAATPAAAACLDLPSRFLIFAPANGPAVWARDLTDTVVGGFKLSCSLTHEQWAKVPLARRTCTDAEVTSPSGGQCKVIEVWLPDQIPDDMKADYVIRRNLPE
jgi:hypothetical protein